MSEEFIEVTFLIAILLVVIVVGGGFALIVFDQRKDAIRNKDNLIKAIHFSRLRVMQKIDAEGEVGELVEKYMCYALYTVGVMLGLDPETAGKLTDIAE